jgi:hypothetical protein
VVDRAWVACDRSYAYIVQYGTGALQSSAELSKPSNKASVITSLGSPGTGSECVGELDWGVSPNLLLLLPCPMPGRPRRSNRRRLSEIGNWLMYGLRSHHPRPPSTGDPSKLFTPAWASAWLRMCRKRKAGPSRITYQAGRGPGEAGDWPLHEPENVLREVREWRPGDASFLLVCLLTKFIWLSYAG